VQYIDAIFYQLIGGNLSRVLIGLYITALYAIGLIGQLNATIADGAATKAG
jgi:hypothetical protein